MQTHRAPSSCTNPWRRPSGGPPVRIAHRGAPTERPENTLESFRVALDAGAQILEMDVRTSADGELVVVHDATLDRVSPCRGEVAAMTWAELRNAPLCEPKGGRVGPCRIPRLEEVLWTFPTAAMNVDLSAVSAAMVPQVYTWIRGVQKSAHANLRVLLTSSSAATQHAICANKDAAGVLLGMGRQDVVEVIRAAWLHRPAIERLRGRACQMPAYVKVVGIDVPLLTGPVPAYLERMGCPLHVWWEGQKMVDDDARLRRCVRWQVDGVFTDRIVQWGMLRNI